MQAKENETERLGLLEASAIRELASIGVGHAMTSLSELTGRTFGIVIPSVQLVDLDQVPELIGARGETTVGVTMLITGDISGHMAFLLPWVSAQELWRLLLGVVPESPADVDQMTVSMALEVGNIMISSFLGALSEMTHLRLTASPPFLSIDLSASVVTSLVAQAQASGVLALSIDTLVAEAGSNMIRGYFLCIPDRAGLRLLLSQLGIPEAA